MVSVKLNNAAAVAANSSIPWENGIYTNSDRASSGSPLVTLGRCGYYSVDFDMDITTAAADTILGTLLVDGADSTVVTNIATTAADTPVHGGFNTVLRVTKPTTLSVKLDSAVSVLNAQLTVIHL